MEARFYLEKGIASISKKITNLNSHPAVAESLESHYACDDEQKTRNFRSKIWRRVQKDGHPAET